MSLQTIVLMLVVISPTLALPSTAEGGTAAPPVWQVGVNSEFYPLAYRTAQGDPAGLGIDLVRAIAAKEGVELTFKFAPWHTLRQDLEQGRIDIIPAMVYSNQRSEKVNFSVPYVRGRLALFRHETVPAVVQVDELNSRRIAVINSSVSHDYLRQRAPAAQLVLTGSIADLSARLDDGSADYYMRVIFDGDNGTAQTSDPDILSNSLQQAELQRWVSIATPKHNDELREVINQGLAAVIGTGEYDQLWANWSTELEASTIVFNDALKILFWVILGGAVIMLLVLLWSWSLKRQVLHRTQRLVEETHHRQQLENRLQQGFKMEALGQLSGGIAHDFNNILTSILGYTELASERLGQQQYEKLANYLQQVEKASLRAIELINQLLLFSRSQSGEQRHIQPAVMIEEVRLLLEASLPKAVVVELEGSTQASLIRVDPIKFHQMLVNLCVNARDAMQGRGRIRISSRPVSTVDLRCTACGADLTGVWVEVAVSDNGAGIDPQQHAQIFNLGFTTKGPGQGTGTGLSTVNRLLHEHQGHLVLQSRPGAGSTFRLLFPKADGTDSESALELPPMSRELRGRRILVIDPDATFRTLISELLRGCGCIVTGWCDMTDLADSDTYPVTLLNHPRTDGLPPQDLILLGGSLCQPCLRETIESFASQPVVLCSDMEADLQPSRWRPLGLAEVILKPVAPEELIARLGALLNDTRVLGARDLPSDPSVDKRCASHE